MKIKVTFFFRKPFQDYFSIEEVFKNIERKLQTDIEIKNYYLKFFSKGIVNRVKSCFEVLAVQGDINHITGDVHYISYFLKKQKTILTIHDLAPLKNSKGLKKYILKLFWYTIPIRSVRWVTVISEFTKRELIEECRFSEDKIKVIPNPVPLELVFKPKSDIPVKPVLLQIGTAYNKNLEGLIMAVRNLEVHLNIIGNLSNNQLKMLEDFNISYSNFKNLDYKEVISCYLSSDIVCFATLYEGFGLPILEAQAIGRPVVTSNRCSMPEVAGEGALFINPNDNIAYKNAVESLIEDRCLRESLVKKGAKNVKRFSAEKIAELYLDLYKTCL